jgi:radical SAM superfamily enzyme
VKLHFLYVLEGTEMAEIYRNGGYFPLEMDHYVDLAVRSLELLKPDTVIGRLTGDGAESDLLAPLWGKKKRCVLNEIDKKFYKLDSYQGKNFGKN